MASKDPCRISHGSSAAPHEESLTTRTRRLPRPEALTQLYVKRSRGEPVDQPEIERLGRDAVREVAAKQREAGIDVGNNGEQQRELVLPLSARAAIPGSAAA